MKNKETESAESKVYSSHDTAENRVEEYSPAWIVQNSSESTAYKIQIIDRIRDGVKKSAWKELLHTLGATEKEFENILPTSISSMQKKSVYGPETSERIYELARLFAFGYEVFDSKDDFKKWLQTSSPALGNRRPIEFLDSSMGFEMVRNAIGRIKYNVYS
jgi:putative toxin-antitoxin system antitoxin component (TIGR02293 family)